MQVGLTAFFCKLHWQHTLLGEESASLKWGIFVLNVIKGLRKWGGGVASWCGDRRARAAHRYLDRLLQGGHHTKAAYPRILELLSVSMPAFPPTMTYWRKL